MVVDVFVTDIAIVTVVDVLVTDIVIVIVVDVLVADIVIFVIDVLVSDIVIVVVFQVYNIEADNEAEGDEWVMMAEVTRLHLQTNTRWASCTEHSRFTSF